MCFTFCKKINSSDNTSHPSRRLLAIIGCVLLAGPLYSALGTIIGIVRAFTRLSKTGHADPSELAGDISIAILTTLYDSISGIFGTVLVSIVLFRRLNREKWFYMCVTTLSIFWCLLLFPFGLVFGIYLLAIFGRRKSEFYPLLKKSAEQAAPCNP